MIKIGYLKCLGIEPLTLLRTSSNRLFEICFKGLNGDCILITLNGVLKHCFELYLKCILRLIHSQSYKQSSNRLFEICFKTLTTDRILNTFKWGT